MQLLVADDITSFDDTTNLSYWLNWRFLLCAIWVLTPMFISSYLIWKYETPNYSKSDDEGTEDQRSGILWDEVGWRPCVKEIPPIFLLIFRVTAFCLLSVALSFDIVVHGADIFLYYTQWTFTLITVYFAVGSLLSIYGCYYNSKKNNDVSNVLDVDAEKGIYLPLASENVTNGERVKDLNYREKSNISRFVGIWSYLYEILFQMTAGAVMLTDSIYWCVIFPFLSIKNYEMSFLTVISHSLNVVLLLGEAALNSLLFPWFRIAYFILWTGSYVIFQWIVHACVRTWWPYPFLDLSGKYAPLWYLVVGVLHFPCYAIVAQIMKLKQSLLSRCIPQSQSGSSSTPLSR